MRKGIIDLIKYVGGYPTFTRKKRCRRGWEQWKTEKPLSVRLFIFYYRTPKLEKNLPLLLWFQWRTFIQIQLRIIEYLSRRNGRRGVYKPSSIIHLPSFTKVLWTTTFQNGSQNKSLTYDKLVIDINIRKDI